MIAKTPDINKTHDLPQEFPQKPRILEFRSGGMSGHLDSTVFYVSAQNAPKGQPHNSPGQGKRESYERAVALGKLFDRAVALKGRNNDVQVCVALTGLFVDWSHTTQGDVPRLRRSTLPWADMWLPRWATL